MARWIKSDGDEQEVKPFESQDGTFSNAELRQFVGGPLTGVILTHDEQGLFMWMNEQGFGRLPYNQKATEELHTHRPDYMTTYVYGDALVTDITEAGEE
ncbi:MAG TPA: hypothetical protein VHL10_05255 [Nitrososphaera sp.]|jgi:hypothetical protein|nr:hypothetical protein [Nitrososphaera sp.]